MRTKLISVVVCLFLYIPTIQSQCVVVANQNTVGGTVFNDANQNSILDGTEPGVNNASVNLYQDNNGDGIIDSGDTLVGNTTSNASGEYAFVINESTVTSTVLDQFNSTSYSNNNGSENWTENWQEIGESNGVNDGNVSVVNNKLRFGENAATNRTITGDGVDRIVDLSTYTTATLTFDFDKDDETDSDDIDWYVRLQVSTDGTNYTTLENFNFTDAQTAYSYDISAYISATTHIRFVGQGTQERREDDWIHFDNIEVSYTKADTAFPDYIVAIDATSVTGGLTTSSFQTANFTGFGQVNCDNNFGVYLCGPNCPPVSEDDYVTVFQGESVTIAVLDNDTDGDGNIDEESVFVITEPTNGSISIDDFGNVIYSPNGSYTGTDSFVYEVCDETLVTPLCDTATVYITIEENFIDTCLQSVQEQTYYVPFPDDELRTALFNSIASTCTGNMTNNVNRVISLKSPYPGTIVTYDHWEDGYEADINNPTQATTQVWGDQNILNGTSPEYSDDFIPSGGDIVLENTYNYNPRNSTNIVYDGKDKIHTSNDVALSVVAGDVAVFDVQLAKTDVYSVGKYGTSFVVPYGEDLGQEFQYTSLFIRASQDATVINVDLDNDGTIDDTATINQGEVMFIDGGVNSGATISSDKPVGVDLFFGANECYSTRQINLLPGKYYSDTYYSPVPTVNTDAPSVVYFYNSLSRSIDIDWSSNANTGTITVAAKSSNSISLSDNSGYKFVSQGGESYVASQVIDSDANGRDYDWSFNLISETRLTDFAAIAWAPGTSDESANYNPVWVTPTANTTIYIKYDGNLQDATASTSPCGIPYDQSLALNALNYTQIFDTFNNDNDQSGLAVYTCDGTKIFAVFGQDASLAPNTSPAIDVGTTMQPLCLNPLIFANDDTANALTDTPINIEVSANDNAFLTTLNIGSITTTGLLQPSNGLVAINADGTVTYTPNNGFGGVDTFQYSICSVEFPDVCGTATVIVEVSDCSAPPNKNIVYGQVYFDLNEDTINNDGIGVEDIDVNIYTDSNNDGIVDSGDVLLNILTTNNAGFYQFEALNYNVVVKEDFSSSDYAGGTGWSTNWVEVGDDSNPLTGNVRIEGAKKRLLIKDDTEVYRSTNLAGVTTANISFKVREYGNLEASDDILVQICTDNSFTNCQTIYVKANDFVGETVNNIEIDADKLTSTTTLRIQANGFTSSSERLYIDNVKLRYQVTTDNLVIETDPASYPAGYSFSTDNVEVANFSGVLGICDKNNDFGVIRCNLTESGLIFDCNDNGTPLDTSDDFYNVILDPIGTNVGGTYSVTGDLTGSGTYGTPLSFGPFPVTSGDKIITITDNSGNCTIEDIEITVSEYSCLNLSDNYSIDFDGVDDYITSDLNIGGYTQATIMAWIKLDPTATNVNAILDQEYINIKVKADGTVAANVNQGSITLPTSTALTLNEWVHITLVYNSGLPSEKLKLYLNGALEGSNNHVSLTTGIEVPTETFTIGKNAQLSNQFFKGAIDEFRVFDLALSEDQMRKIIYQEIESSGASYTGSVSGLVVPKTIVDITSNQTIPWANLKAYYPMTDIVSNKTIDFSGNGYDATLHNITTIQEQTAPMPYQTSADGDLSDANNLQYGNVWNMNALANSGYAVVRISHNVSVNSDLKTLGLLVDSGKTITMNGTNEVNNSWYLGLDGTIDLREDSQLVQGIQSDLVTSADGKILRRQEGASSVYWYNYWASPVGVPAATSYLDNNASTNNPNNTTFTHNMLKEGTGSAVEYTNSYNEIGKVSTYWLYAFENGVTYYDWNHIGNTGAVSPGLGYTQKGTGVGTEQQYIFEGKPNNGTILINAIDTGGAGSTEGTTETSSLLGNPYPSAIDARQFITDNASGFNPVIDGTIRLWQQWAGNSHTTVEYEGGYAYINAMTTVRAAQYPYPGSGATPTSTKRPSFYIPVSQGFFVEVINNGDIEFNNGQRVFIKESDADENNPYVGSEFFKTNSNTSTEPNTTEPNYQLLRLKLEMSDTSSRTMVLGFDPSFTDQGREYGFDGGFITTPLSNDLGSLLNGDQYVIQALAPITDDKVVDLTFTATGTETYTIKSIEIANIDPNQDIYLRDNLLGVYHDLRNEQGYSFISEAGTFNNRFDVVFSRDQTLSTEEFNTVDDTTIFYNNTQEVLFIKGLKEHAKQLTLYNALGQNIYQKQNIDKEVLKNGITVSNLSTGLYIVNIKTENNVIIDKKIIVE